ncbi:cytochrome P450 [Pollutimonas subterranea]|uniref:Cytochrome P450 n=2 Tax=Pollutimonas subterranea TaxID=2045210 RepID=A0A2N4U264_9BURK|nr:cytochrome P450 [Pollutimonas subterranea]
MRRTCPVAHSEFLQWSVFRHADVVAILNDHETFSSEVSAHMSVPNGMDPPTHTEYRRIVDAYFTPAYIDTYAPICRDIASTLASTLPRGEVELMGDFAQTFALQMQSAYLGWPQDLHEPLRAWIQKNRQATLAGDRPAMAAIAFEFDGYIRDMLDVRRRAGVDAPADITTSLLSDKVHGRPLTDDEIVSILRNWTVGELSTMASCVGIIAYYLASNPSVQAQLREQPSLLPAAIDEILRMQAPLIANRRIATKPVNVGGRQLDKGDRLSLIWASANRDEAVFGDPDEFRLDRDPDENLLYGRGIHVCPGAPLARLELHHITEQLLLHTDHLSLVPGKPAQLAVYPGGGFSVLPLCIA